MVGSYWGTFSRGLLGDAGCPIYNRQQRLLTVSTKCCRVNCMVSAVFPTPPSPSTTSLYSTILPAMMKYVVRADAVTQRWMGEWKRKREGSNSSGKHTLCAVGGERGSAGGDSFWYVSQEARTSACGVVDRTVRDKLGSLAARRVDSGGEGRGMQVREHLFWGGSVKGEMGYAWRKLTPNSGVG